MEDPRITRQWGKKSHGSTLFSNSSSCENLQPNSFPSRFEDYCEIFGGVSSASSIPVLDFPPSDDELCQIAAVDYSEIFGADSCAGFSVSYDEIFGGSRKSGVSCFDGSARLGVLPEQQENEASEHLMESYSEDHLTNLQMAKASSGPHHSDDASSKNFSISYYKTSRGMIDDLIGEKTNMVKLDAVPEFMVMVDASNLNNQQVNSEITNNTGTKRYMHDGGQENEAPSNSSSNAAYSENLQVDQTPSNLICDSLLDASDSEKHHSRSSSYHSASSGDISLFDVEYLNISEISLQTKPLQVPPPSRPPPQLNKKPDHPEMVHLDSSSDPEERSLLKPMLKYHMHSSNSATKIDAIDENMEDKSCCNDNEMDPNSAAAASVAAVKAAMEQAQAQLKIARELMDKKRDKYKRKADQPKAMNCEEDGANYEVASKSYSKMIASNNMLKENTYSINEYTFLEREEIRNAGTTALKHEKKGRFPSSGENQQQLTPDNDFKSTEAACEFGELSDELKSEKNELIRNGGLLNEVKDNFMHKNEKKAKKVMFVCQDSKKGEQAFEFLENQNTSEASCRVEKFENDHNLNGASMAYMNDSNTNFVNAIMEDFLLTESASKLNEAQKEGDVHEDNTTKDEDNSLNPAVDSCLCKDNEKMFQVLSSSFKPEVDNDFCKETEFKGAENIFRNMGNKMEFHVNHVNFELNGSHKLFNIANEAVFQGRTDEKSKMSDGLCSNNTTGKMEVAKETRKFNENVKETESLKYLYGSNVSEFKVEENNNATEVYEADVLQANAEVCILTKNELEKGTIHNANWLEYGKERRDAPIELQEDESVGPDRNQELHNFEFLAEAKRDCAEKESESASEVPVANNLEENDIISTSVKEVCQQCEESLAPEIILSGMEDNSQAKALDTTEVSYSEVAENHQHSIHNEEEKSKKADTEKERDREQVMRLEEREREREREKDRIAVEIANHDARQRAVAEARERADRIAVERVTSEARQRALADARKKAEKAGEAERALKEARLRERAAVERVTEEARQRAIEKALAEKVAIEARSRIRKGNATAYTKATHVKEDSETRVKSSSEILQNTQFQNPCSTNGHKYSDSCNNGFEVRGSESNLRCKARQERQQRTAERAAKALTEKNLRDILAQREQAERDRLSEFLDAEVRRWSSGKEGNLRALLSTLHYILGSDSGWQAVPLTSVLTADGVKKAYRKATLCVHPDKLQQRGATIQQKYICEKVFDLLKEAWSRLNSEER